MKLIYVIRSLHATGGIERTLTDKANWLVSHGHEVAFVTYHQGRDDIYFPLDSRVQLFDVGCSIFSLYKYPLYSRLFHFIKLRHLFMKRIKHVLDVFLPDVVSIAIPSAEDFIWEILNVAANTPIVVESHIAYDHFLDGKTITDRLLYLFYSPLKTIRKADMLVALTKRDAQNWQRHQVDNVKVISNPVACFREKMDAACNKENRVIAVGRLVKQKRFDRLIDAFAIIASRYPLWRVTIFGEGEFKDALETQVRELGIEGRVEILPYVQNLLTEYQRSQFLVLSSDFEGFGLVITEAMACGLPVVATDCPCGPSEIIEDGVTGLLANMDAYDLAEKMEWMITHNQERKEMGIKAYQAATRFRKEVIMPEWESAYKSVIH